MYKLLISLTFVLTLLTSVNAQYVSVGTSLFITQETADLFVKPEIEIGYKFISFSTNTDIHRLTANIKPLNWLIINAGFSFLTFKEQFKDKIFNTNSTGITAAIAFEFKNIGIKTIHDLHKMDNWLGGTSTVLYFKVSI